MMFRSSWKSIDFPGPSGRPGSGQHQPVVRLVRAQRPSRQQGQGRANGGGVQSPPGNGSTPRWQQITYRPRRSQPLPRRRN